MAQLNFYSVHYAKFSFLHWEKNYKEDINARTPKEAYEKWAKKKGLKRFLFLKDNNWGTIYYKKDIFGHGNK